MYKNAKTELDTAIADLCTAAIFFCMRSCEYLKVPDQLDRRTKLLTIKNIRFFDNDKQLVEHNSPILHLACIVVVTFEDQKNRTKFEDVTHYRSGHKLLCPVIAWSKIIKRVRSYKGSNGDTPVCTFIIQGHKQSKTVQISSDNVIKALRTTVRTMTAWNLGFTAEEIGTHSIRSGGAMMMCLAGVREYIIMIQGRWKSMSYMKYIRKQIAQFSCELTSRMIKHDHFNHIPSFRDIGHEGGAN